jgi:thiosulfate reductase cytochrome b subunit
MNVVVHEQRHHFLLRLAHWCQALAILIMIGSGWRIYNQEPILPFRFPVAFTLGGTIKATLSRNNDPGVANAIAWHFAGMWLLAGAFLLYMCYGIVSGHFRRHFIPVGPKSFVRDFIAAATFKLPHTLGVYNAVQRGLYWAVLFAIFMMIVSGLAIWKPVQLAWITFLLGGFQGARIVHFLFMSGIVGFLAVHVALVALVPRTLRSMVLGRATETVFEPEPERLSEAPHHA